VLAAAVLAAEQVSFELVGSAALWLRGEQITVGDAALVIEPGEANLRRLHEAIAALAVRSHEVPPVHRRRDLSVATIITSDWRVDCLLERGRRDLGPVAAGRGVCGRGRRACARRERG
jgi:hypothetical protein